MLDKNTLLTKAVLAGRVIGDLDVVLAEFVSAALLGEIDPMTGGAVISLSASIRDMRQTLDSFHGVFNSLTVA
jgi:hypothetical protein